MDTDTNDYSDDDSSISGGGGGDGGGGGRPQRQRRPSAKAREMKGLDFDKIIRKLSKGAWALECRVVCIWLGCLMKDRMCKRT